MKKSTIILLGLAVVSCVALANEVEASDERTLAELSAEELEAEEDVMKMMREMTTEEGEDPLERAMSNIESNNKEDYEFSHEFDEEGYAVQPRQLSESENKEDYEFTHEFDEHGGAFTPESEDDVATADEENQSSVNGTRALSESEAEAESETGRRTNCKACCKKCNCGGCSKGAQVPGRAYSTSNGKQTIVVYDEPLSAYKKRTKSCKPPIPPKKCTMKMVVHHLTNEIEICKECIVNKHEALYHKCRKQKVVIPVPPIFPKPTPTTPPHPAKWHQVCTCTWVRNGKDYRGPKTVWHKNEKKEARRKSHQKYLSELREYREKMRKYAEKKAAYERKHRKYEAAKRHAEWLKKHEEAAARIFNRRNHKAEVHRIEKEGFSKKHPLRVLCPCNNAGARQLSMHEIQMPAIREAAQVAFGEEAEQMLSSSVVSPQE